MKNLLALLIALICSTASAIDYPVAAIRSPRYGDGTQPGDKRITVPEIVDPTRIEPGSDLILRNPDGSITVLVDAGDHGGITSVKTYDGVWLFFAWVKDTRPASLTGSDIYKINVQTGQIVQLTHGEFTPNKGAANWNANPLTYSYPDPRGLGLPIYNLGPQPLPGGRVTFTSSRNGYLPGDATTFTNQQLYLMDDDGKNVEQTGYINLGSALDPVLMKNGRIMWSTAETQGHRAHIHWSLWSSNPDLTDWESMHFSAHGGGSPSGVHFQAQFGDGDSLFTRYYASNNWGFGAMYGVPSTTTEGVSAWGHVKASLNPPLSSQFQHYFPFQRYGMWAATPWTVDGDHAAPNGIGKVSMPSGAPNNHMLICYSPGPVSNTAATGSVPLPWLHSKIALMKTKTTASPAELEILLDDPNYNYIMPIAVVPFQQIYGQPATEIQECPWINNAALPKGSPFCLMGTGSFYRRESATENDNEAWVGQGTGPEFDSADIHSVRVLVQEPTSNFREGQHFTAVGMERLRTLGEIPLRKAPGVTDLNGHPDTSVLWKMPADTSVMFQVLNTEGEALTTSQNWNTGRPGEVMVKCNGCHAHHDAGLTKFSTTEAAKPTYQIASLTSAVPNAAKEWLRDVWPIMAAKCVSCHATGTPAPLIDQNFNHVDGRTVANQWAFGYSARTSKLYTKAKEGHGGLTAAELKTLGLWIDTGMQRNLPWGGINERVHADDHRPTLFLDSPRRKEASPLTVLRFGAHDYYSGLASRSVKASWVVNGRPAGTELQDLFTVTDFVWTLPLTESFTGNGQITVIATDAAGNEQKIVRDFTAADGPPIDPCAAAIAQLQAQIAALQMQATVDQARIAELEAKINAIRVIVGP